MTRAALSLSLNGDSGSVYTVTLAGHADGRASLRCSCPAGKKGTLCKHLRALLAGDFGRVAAEEPNLEEFRRLLAASALPGAAAPLLQRLVAAEKRQEALKKEISGLKKDIWGWISAQPEK